MTTIESILSRLTKAVGGTEKMLYTEPELNKFAKFYLDKWDENTSEDVIAESFTDFWWDTDRACRRCSECGRLMRKGYWRRYTLSKESVDKITEFVDTILES